MNTGSPTDSGEERVSSSDSTRFLGFSTSPLLDLMALSGFGILASDVLATTAFAETVRSCWDTYLRGEHAAERVKLFLSIPDMKVGLFALFPRDIVRTRWSQIASRWLVEHGLEYDLDYLSFCESGHATGRTPLLKSLSGHLMMLQGEEIFAATYLARRREAVGVTVPPSVADLIGRIDRYSKASGAPPTGPDPTFSVEDGEGR